MVKKLIIGANNTQELVELEGAELKDYNDRISALETAKQEEETAKQVKADLKASAKAKLLAGEPLTEEEANTIVL